MAKNKRKSVRMSEEEENIISIKAEIAGMKFSEFVREASLNHSVTVIPGIKDLYLQVAKIGNNLNQLTMLCHQGSIICPNIDSTSEILNKIYAELSKISEVIYSGDGNSSKG